MSLIIHIFQLLRPKQWLKNFFVLVPLIFNGMLLDKISLFNAAYVFVLFCIAASSVYVFNDITDLQSDRNHPIKSLQRPIAAGHISIKLAVIILVLLYV